MFGPKFQKLLSYQSLKILTLIGTKTFICNFLILQLLLFNIATMVARF